jgi:tight adherence protein B
VTGLAAVLLASVVLLWPVHGRTSGIPTRPTGPQRRRQPVGQGTRAGRRSRSLPGASRRLREREQTRVLVQLMDALVPALRAGLPPAQALALVSDVVLEPAVPPGGRLPVSGSRAHCAQASAQAAEWLMALRAAAEAGESLGPVWRRWAAAGEAPEVTALARAWSLSEVTGAPLADGVAAAASAARATAAHRHAVEATTAGARATMNLLSVLPLGGVCVAVLAGVGPASLYASRASQACLVAGFLLLSFGRWWVRAMIRRATRAPVVG